MNKQIILASQSPRRQQLLRQAGIDFRVEIREVDEIYPDDLPFREVPAYLAKLKAQVFLEDLKPDDLLITADTIVLHKGDVLGKPKDRQQAIETLLRLSGTRHEVLTGVCISTKNHATFTFTDETTVVFYPLTEETIVKYVDQCAPYDKAGSYAIQEWIGLVGVKRIEGNYHNILGLPVGRLLKILKETYRWS